MGQSFCAPIIWDLSPVGLLRGKTYRHLALLVLVFCLTAKRFWKTAYPSPPDGTPSKKLEMRGMLTNANILKCFKKFIIRNYFANILTCSAASIPNAVNAVVIIPPAFKPASSY